MICTTCCKEISCDTVVCPFCGCIMGVLRSPLMVQHNTRRVEPKVNRINTPYPDINASTCPSLTVNKNFPDEVSVGILVLSVLFFIVGIIFGIVNRSKGLKKSGNVYLLAGVISWVVMSVSSALATPLAVYIFCEILH